MKNSPSFLTSDDHQAIHKHIAYYKSQEHFQDTYLQHLLRLQKALRKSSDNLGASNPSSGSSNKNNWASMGWGQSFDDNTPHAAPIPNDDEITPLHSSDVHFVGSPREGVIYNRSSMQHMPDTVKPPGVYQDRFGRQFFVKTSLAGSSATAQTHGPRAEHTAHRLYDILGGPSMGVASVGSRLHSDALDGGQIPDGHHITHNEGVYLVTPRMPQGAVPYASVLRSLNTENKSNVLRQLDKGFALDALLGGNDMHAANLWIHPDNNVARLDTGGHLGMIPSVGIQAPVFDPGDEAGTFWDSTLANSKRAFLPDFSIIHEFTGGADRLSGQEIIDQMKQVVKNFQQNQQEIRKTIQFHHAPDALWSQLSARINQFVRTIQLYKDSPDLLTQDIKRMSGMHRGITLENQEDIFSGQNTQDIAARMAADNPSASAAVGSGGVRTRDREKARALNRNIKDLSGQPNLSYPESLLGPIRRQELGLVDNIDYRDVVAPGTEVPVPMQFAAHNFGPEQLLDTSEGQYTSPDSPLVRLTKQPSAVYARARAGAIKQNRAALRRWFRAQAVRQAIREGRIDPRILTPSMFGNMTLEEASRRANPLDPDQLRLWRTDGEYGRGSKDDFIDQLERRSRFAS